MKLVRPVLSLLLGLSVLASPALWAGRAAAAQVGRHAISSSTDANTLTIMTCCGAWAGFTRSTIAGEGIPYLGYYKDLWQRRFPDLRIKEIDVQSQSEIDTKTILGVNSGTVADLIVIHGDIGMMAARHALMNLDPFYQRAHVTASMFLPAMASWAQVRGHWYGIPAASGPSANEILYIPTLVRAAGWDPNHVPTTWAGLWTATQKVTKRDSKGTLERIGIRVDGASRGAINLFCGYFAVYDPKTSRFHANSPCIKDYFRFEKRLLDFYGGVTPYTKFISGDAGVWNGYSTKAYIPTGKIVFPMEAYWTGQQMDNYWNLDWRLSPPPTPHGTLAERAANDAVTQWMVAIPAGAKHAQLAFDFAKFTLWDKGWVQGPTTNGYVIADQASKWAQVVIRTAGSIRSSHHFPGNPMAKAVGLVMQDARLARAFTPNDVATDYYDQQLGRAWDQIRYGRASVDQALDEMQRLVDSKQRMLHAQFGLEEGPVYR